MTEIAKSEIFFFITSISIVVLTIMAIVILVYVFFAVKKVNQLIDKVKEESDFVVDDIRAFRIKMKNEHGFLHKVPVLFSFFKDVFKVRKTRQRKAQVDETEEE